MIQRTLDGAADSQRLVGVVRIRRLQRYFRGRAGFTYRVGG
jgi:hypothetical protein